MERAPLRPVPRRPEGPVDSADAIAHVATALPAADEPARAALALVEIAGRPRSQVAAERGLAPAEVADALARGRKALRRSMYPLPGSGWCERAERMISDRIDDELEPPGPARLDAHLRNCPRCVEHELRLAQAVDSLVAAFIEAHPSEAPQPAATAVSRPVIRAARPELRVLPFGAPVAPTPAKPLVVPMPDPVVETIDAGITDAVAVAKPERSGVRGPGSGVSEPAEPAAPVAPAEPARPPAARAFAWNALYALAVLLAVLTVIVTVLGVAGVDPF
jgi:anti-sigma factor RsiW